MWADIVQLAGLRRHPGVIQNTSFKRASKKSTTMLMAPDPTEGKGHRCHYDEDWGFKVCYDMDGCRLGAKQDAMVLIDKFVSPHATLDSEVYGSFCQGQ